MVRDLLRVSDGTLNVDGGVDSGRAPNLLGLNQLSFAINTTMRGGWATSRPGWRQIALEFDNETTQLSFENGLFQFAGGYVSDSTEGFIISMHGGRQVKITIVDGTTFKVEDISIAGDLNPANRQQAWGTQAENYFIIQDGQNAPFIYNGSTSRRAVAGAEIPVGRQITYYMGRIWTVIKPRAYVAGDIVFGPSGTPQLKFRDSVLKMTENQFLNEGGEFGVPSTAGEITALLPMSNLNTALGQGELIVGTKNLIFATAVPINREEWKSATQPLQRIIQLNYGPLNQDGCVIINDDLFYRATDGWRSLKYAVRYFNDWGNTPISNEMNRILANDSVELLPHCSAVLFDNRFIGTASPTFYPNGGVYHRCLTPLDFDLISRISGKLPPAWEGIWTGLKVLKILKVAHRGVERCFIFALDPDNKVTLWEQTKAEDFDNGDRRIQWSTESRSMDFGAKFDQKNLQSADIFVDQLKGDISVHVDFRPDSNPCWIPWHNWTDCGKFKTCDDFGTCPTLVEYLEQYRPKVQLPQPPDSSEPSNNEFHRRFFELQVRFRCTGKFRLKQTRYNALITQEPPYGRNL